MLPILRIIPVGGVLLAIAITALALSPPDGSESLGMRVGAPARGPLLDRESHPEWRHFLIQAALRRAGELERLRELPDTAHRDSMPGIAAPPTDAGLPQSAPEPLAVEIPAAPAETGALQPAPLPATPVLAVHNEQIPALQPSDDADGNVSGNASSAGAESAGTDSDIVRAALPVGPGALAGEPPAAAVFLDALEKPERQEISAAVEDATLPIENDAVNSATQTFAAPHAPDGDAAFAASETIPPTKGADDDAGKVLALVEDVPVGDVDASTRDVKASAEFLSRADAGHTEDRPDDTVGIREAALSVPLPRESTRRLVEPRQNRRAAGLRTRPAGTDVRQTNNPDFFEALLRIFSTNARSPGGDTIATRRIRVPY